MSQPNHSSKPKITILPKLYLPHLKLPLKLTDSENIAETDLQLIPQRSLTPAEDPQPVTEELSDVLDDYYSEGEIEETPLLSSQSIYFVTDGKTFGNPQYDLLNLLPILLALNNYVYLVTINDLIADAPNVEDSLLVVPDIFLYNGQALQTIERYQHLIVPVCLNSNFYKLNLPFEGKKLVYSCKLTQSTFLALRPRSPEPGAAEPCILLKPYAIKLAIVNELRQRLGVPKLVIEPAISETNGVLLFDEGTSFARSLEEQIRTSFKEFQVDYFDHDFGSNNFVKVVIFTKKMTRFPTLLIPMLEKGIPFISVNSILAISPVSTGSTGFLHDSLQTPFKGGELLDRETWTDVKRALEMILDNYSEYSRNARRQFEYLESQNTQVSREFPSSSRKGLKISKRAMKLIQQQFVQDNRSQKDRLPTSSINLRGELVNSIPISGSGLRPLANNVVLRTSLKEQPSIRRSKNYV